MANSPNLITRSTSLADLLATAVSDGTYEDVIETAKVDKAGHEVPASAVSDAGGQLWANLVDDAVKRTAQMFYRSCKLWSVAGTAERDALGSDDDLEAGDLAIQQDTATIHVCTNVDGESASTWMQVVGRTAPQSAELAQSVNLPENQASSTFKLVGLGWPTDGSQITAVDWADVAGSNSGDPPVINGYTFDTIAGIGGSVSVQSIEIDFDTTHSAKGDVWAFLLRTTTCGDLVLALVTISE